MFVDADGGLFVCPVSTRGRFGVYREPGDLQRAWGSPKHLSALDTLSATSCRRCVSNCMSSESGGEPLLRQAIGDGRPVIIFGASSRGHKVLEQLRRLGGDAVAFVDNAPDAPRRARTECPVLNWSAGESCRDAFVIIASGTGGRQIAGQLEGIGLQEGRDFFRYY